MPPATGFAIQFRPILEIPRLKKALALSGRRYDIYMVFDPYALEAVRESGIYRNTRIIYYSLEIWDAFRFWPQRCCEYFGRKVISALIAPQKDRLNYLVNVLAFDGPSMVFPNISYDLDETISVRI